ncbi:MAG: hypothetical protein WBW04_16800 [Nitrolancea sp.]
MTAFYVVLGAILFFVVSLLVAYVNRRVGHGHRSNPRTEPLREAEMEYLTRQNHM